MSFGKKIAKQYVSSKDYSKYGRFVEHDYYDLVGAYGFLLGIVLIIVPLFFLLKSFKNLIYKRTLLNFTSFIMMTIFISHAFIAGHALNSPTVSTIIIVVYYHALYHQKFYAKN